MGTLQQRTDPIAWVFVFSGIVVLMVGVVLVVAQFGGLLGYALCTAGGIITCHAIAPTSVKSVFYRIVAVIVFLGILMVPMPPEVGSLGLMLKFMIASTMAGGMWRIANNL